MTQNFYYRPKRVVLPQAGPVSEQAVTPILEAAMEQVQRKRWAMRDGEEVVYVDQWVDEDGNPAPPPTAAAPLPPKPWWFTASDEAWAVFGRQFAGGRGGYPGDGHP